MADLMNMLYADVQPQNMLAAAPYGTRENGTPKGSGYFGMLKRPDGNASSELSFDFDAGGQNIFAPLMVPTLSKQELDHLLGGNSPTASIYRKAQDHAMQRIRDGKPTFAAPGEYYLPPVR